MRNFNKKMVCECGKKAVVFAFWRDEKYYEDCKEYESILEKKGIPKFRVHTVGELLELNEDFPEEKIYEKYGGKFAVKKVCDICLNFIRCDYSVSIDSFYESKESIIDWMIHLNSKGWFNANGFLDEINRKYSNKNSIERKEYQDNLSFEYLKNN